MNGWLLRAVATIVASDPAQVDAVGFEDQWWRDLGLDGLWQFLQTYREDYHQWPPWQRLVDLFALPPMPPDPADREPLLVYRDQLWREWAIHQTQQLLSMESYADHFEELPEKAQQWVEVLQSNPRRTTVADMVQTAPARMADLADQGPVPLWKTGFTYWDEFIGGWLPSEYVVIGARPYVGKTWTLLSLAQGFWEANHVPILFCNLELDAVEFNARWDGMQAKKPFTQFLSDEPPADKVQWAMDLQAYATGLQGSPPFYVLHRGNMKRQLRPQQIVSLIERLGVKAVFIDQMSKLDPDGRVHDIRERYLTVSRDLHDIAIQKQCPIFLCAQINREGDGEEKPPPPKDVQESDNLFQDAITFMTMCAARKDPQDPGVLLQIWKSHLQDARAHDLWLHGHFTFNHPPHTVWWDMASESGQFVQGD